jgi:hypothetical protein
VIAQAAHMGSFSDKPQGFLPQLDEFYFTTSEKKILENCRYIVPNFMND